MFHVVFYRPEIPPNTGNAIRMVACTGARLHLIEPLGFDLDEPKLRRAGLDYHDLARVTVHPDLDSAWRLLPGRRVLALTTSAQTLYTDIAFRVGDVLLFGPESVGLPAEVANGQEVSERIRIPMLSGRRSLNLANSAAVATFEAWRQHAFATPGDL